MHHYACSSEKTFLQYFIENHEKRKVVETIDRKGKFLPDFLENLFYMFMDTSGSIAQ